ncbi:hypothetical protein EYC80_000596 [Monilinia laxa]|uniref:Myb-like domain-containing protein n=1 Tax=Monilinia laxa TaxID=61186 RepID=A0A5N6KBD2_MONLA|nr:hypothetical protein EYC80_000596 [Monilinia laxa]
MSETFKLTPADANLLWAIFAVVPRRELSKMVDWKVVGTKLGGLNQKAVTKRWSRLNIKMREDSDDGDIGEVDTGATQEILSGGESGNDGQKVDTEETSGGKTSAKKRTRIAPVKPTTGTGITEDVASDDGAGTGGQIITIKETACEKATAKKRCHKSSVKNKATTGKGKVLKTKATWKSVKAEVAAEAKGKEKGTQEGFDSED